MRAPAVNAAELSSVEAECYGYPVPRQGHRTWLERQME
jgi:hypothetical protein